MSISVDLSTGELEELKLLTKAVGDSEAILLATREFVRLTRLRELKAASGRVEYQLDERKLDELEIGEVSFPV